MTKNLKKYPCSQGELFTIANMAWQNCAGNINQFTTFKPKYVQAFVDQRLAEVEAMHRLPDAQQRTEIAETLRLLMTEQSKTGLATWQKLKRYIAEGFPEALRISKYDAAGQSYYNAASKNWDKCELLLKAGSVFLEGNADTLIANNNMPASFPAEYELIFANYRKIHHEFLEGESHAVTGTLSKTIACNKIYADMMMMLSDAKEIFKKDVLISKDFVYENLLAMVSRPGAARIRGTVVTEDGAPVSGI